MTDCWSRRLGARAFATDALARGVADRALARGFDQATNLAVIKRQT